MTGSVIWTTITAALLLAGAGPAHPVEPKAVLEKVGFPADTQEKVAAGQFVSTSLPTGSERDLNVAIAFLIKEAPDALVQKVRDEKPMEAVDQSTIANGDLQGEGTIAQLAKLQLTAAQLKSYAAAKPGEDLNLSAEEIAALNAVANDDNALQNKVRELLLARYRAYRANGLKGITPYARKGSQANPADDLARVDGLVRRSGLLSEDFYDLLDNYPKDAPAGLEESYRWSQFKAHGQDTIALVHVFRGTFDGNRVTVQRQFYASTGYNVEQAIAGFLPVEQGTLVIYTNHTSTDQVAGFGGSAKRGIGRKLMAGQLESLFEKARAKVAP